jgi:hypothetical protein
MRRLVPLVLMGICLTVAGCANVSTDADATPRPDRTPSVISTPTHTPPLSTPAPTKRPPADGDMTEPPATDSQPGPPSSEIRGANEVDPADYASQAVDPQNGGIALPGVSFRTDDGRTICGILTWGHLSSQAGTVSCTVDSFREVIPQPADREPFVKSIMADPVSGSYFLYPDWFAQPARQIPVLSGGKSIDYEGTFCAVDEEGVTCTISSTGRGFTISPTGHNLF